MGDLFTQQKSKIIRISTVALSLDYLLRGQLKFLNNYYDILAVSGQDIHLDNVAFREGVRVINIPLKRSISPLKDLVSLWSLYRLFCDEKPQIVHSITPKAGLLTMIAAYFARVPIRIHSFTGLIFPSKTGFFQKLLILMDKVLCFFATNIYPEGEGVKQDLLSFGVTKKKLDIIANGNVNGVDINYFHPKLYSNEKNSELRSDLGIDDKDFVFTFVGRLVADKGINELVSAFKKLKDNSCSQFELFLLLVGDQESILDPLKRKTLNEITNNKNILSLGFRSDIRPYLSISNVLVLPSYREGFPNVVLQAGAMGLPSIVTNINGCNEIIIEGKNGWIIPVKDEDAILDSMKKSMSKRNTIEIKKINIRNRIKQKYQQEFVWNAILKEYESLINKNFG